MKNRGMALLAGLTALVLCMTGCGSGAQADVQSEEVQEEAAEQETEAPAEETKEADVSQEEAQEPSEDTLLLAVSFGTSFNDSRDITIGAIEERLAEAFPQYPVRRAFTAQIIIDKLKERDGLEIDNVTEALDRAVAGGFKTFSLII